MQSVVSGRLQQRGQRPLFDFLRGQQSAVATSSRRSVPARPRHQCGHHLPAIQRARSLSSDTADAASCTLENGLVLRHFTLDELNFLYREVYQQRVYLRHGVTIRPGDTVVDVGANSGLFTLLAAEEAGPGGRVVALEPLQPTFRLLEANVAAHARWCAAQGVGVATPVLLNCGAGAPGQESATFVTYNSSASGWSTMYPDDGEVADNMARYIQNLMEAAGGDNDPRVDVVRRDGDGDIGDHGISELGLTGGAGGELQHQPQQRQQQQQPREAGVPEPALARLARALWRGAPPLRPLLRAAAWLYVRRMLAGQRRWRCPLVPLSQLIGERRLERVDLLKVDVERAELDVLYGISSDDWPRVRQVVVEVHDIGGRLDAVRSLLAGVGFSCLVPEQDPGLAGSTLHMLYAVRDAQRAT